MHRVLNPRIHGFIDYGIVLLLALAPTLFGFSGLPAALCYIIAVAQLGMSLLTAYPLGVAKIIPFPIHGGIELGVGILAIVSPWLFRFSGVAAARNFFLVAGIAVAVVWALTNYKAAELPGRTGELFRQRRHA
ncbi:MAG: hypothetical protein JXB05_30640 [Myxococcaceae bacterium]|nr:hypothetical protein [Myxococcaceae bacterium]